MGSQLVRVCIDDQSLFAISDVLVNLMVDKPPALNSSQFLPHIIEGLAISGTKEIMDTAVIYETFTFPGGTQATRKTVHFENCASIPIHLGIAASRKSSRTCADNND
jgi:hypothetical protein